MWGIAKNVIISLITFKLVFNQPLLYTVFIPQTYLWESYFKMWCFLDIWPKGNHVALMNSCGLSIPFWVKTLIGWVSEYLHLQHRESMPDVHLLNFTRNKTIFCLYSFFYLLKLKHIYPLPIPTSSIFYVCSLFSL